MDTVGFFILPYDWVVQIVYEGGVTSHPKVPSDMICTVPVECMPKIEDEVAEDEIDMDGVSMLSPILWNLSISNFGKD